MKRKPTSISNPEQLWDLYVRVTQAEAEYIARTGRIPDDVRIDVEAAARDALRQAANEQAAVG